jgi:hypothetical protein
VIPNMNAHPTFGAEPGFSNMLPGPCAWETALFPSAWYWLNDFRCSTYQMRSPKHDPQKKVKQIINGTCNLSGRISSPGMNAHIQIKSPIKSFVWRWEPGAK